MRRALATFGFLSLAAQGCIIYEEDYTSSWDTACPDEDVRPDRPEPDPTEPDPVSVVELVWSDADGLQGETLLTALSAADRSVDLSDLSTVTFARDVQVVDQIVRADEVVLLLSVAADAEPGLVDAFVTRTDGSRAIVSQPFQVLELAATGGDDDDDTTTTTPGDDDDDTTTPPGDDDDDSGCVGLHCPVDSGIVDTGCPQ